MVGHKRQDGTLLCPPEESLPSPPPSPTASTRSLSGGPFRPAAVTPDFEVPNELPFRRPNPYWVDPPPLSRSSSSDIFEQEGSVVSTVLASDGASIKSSDDEDTTDDEGTTDDENGFLLNAALKTSTPLVSIFSTPKEDIANLRRIANENSLHLGLMRRPAAGYDGKLMDHKVDRDEHSWWVVMGRNAVAVRHLVHLNQKGKSGLYSPANDVGASQGSGMGLFQVVLAGALGGAAVVFGMARLL